MLIISVLDNMIVHPFQKFMFHSRYIRLFFIIYLQDPTFEQHAMIHTCNLAETMHNKWLHHSCKKMTCLYEATVDDMIWAFMQITKYNLWMKSGSLGKGLDHVPLKLKVAMHPNNLRFLAQAMRLPRARGSHTKNCALERSELFGSTKKKVGLATKV